MPIGLCARRRCARDYTPRAATRALPRAAPSCARVCGLYQARCGERRGRRHPSGSTGPAAPQGTFPQPEASRARGRGSARARGTAGAARVRDGRDVGHEALIDADVQVVGEDVARDCEALVLGGKHPQAHCHRVPPCRARVSTQCATAVLVSRVCVNASATMRWRRRSGATGAVGARAKARRGAACGAPQSVMHMAALKD